MDLNKSFKVFIECFSYNHSKYINEALDGFASQKTNFPYVAVIIDDASIDGEQSLILNYFNNFFTKTESWGGEYETDYASIHYGQHKTNRNCFFAIYLLKFNHYGKVPVSQYYKDLRGLSEYIATCEGDDYWYDVYKLQTQVDFLDKNGDYSICSHRIYKYDQDSGCFLKDRLDKVFAFKKGIEFSNKSNVWLSETCSVVYRRSASIGFDEYDGVGRDNVLIYFILKAGKGFCLNRRMSTYRLHQGGVFSKQNVVIRIVEGSYKALKILHEKEQTSDSRYLYYRSYANTFIATRGRILFQEPFHLKKFISLLFFIPTIIMGVHPVYRVID